MRTQKYEEEVKEIGGYLSCNAEELWSEMSPLMKKVIQEAYAAGQSDLIHAIDVCYMDELVNSDELVMEMKQQAEILQNLPEQPAKDSI